MLRWRQQNGSSILLDHFHLPPWQQVWRYVKNLSSLMKYDKVLVESKKRVTPAKKINFSAHSARRLAIFGRDHLDPFCKIWCCIIILNTTNIQQQQKSPFYCKFAHLSFGPFLRFNSDFVIYKHIYRRCLDI